MKKYQSLKKSNFINNILFGSCLIIVGFISLFETTISFFILLIILFIFLGILLHDIVKKEEADDEMSNEHKKEAKVTAYKLLIMLIFILMLIQELGPILKNFLPENSILYNISFDVIAHFLLGIAFLTDGIVFASLERN